MLTPGTAKASIHCVSESFSVLSPCVTAGSPDSTRAARTSDSGSTAPVSAIDDSGHARQASNAKYESRIGILMGAPKGHHREGAEGRQ
ncbi:hypothetical protein GCM10028795_08350 [Lysobacter olei]